MIRGVLVVAVLAACQSENPAPARDAAPAAVAPTCADMARRGVELALANPDLPSEMREQLAASRDEAIAGGTAECERLRPPPEILACMVSAKTYAEYAACGDKFTP